MTLPAWHDDGWDGSEIFTPFLAFDEFIATKVKHVRRVSFCGICNTRLAVCHLMDVVVVCSRMYGSYSSYSSYPCLMPIRLGFHATFRGQLQ